MNNQKQKFIDFLLNKQSLLFGQYTLKSGRVSPYFFNLGCLNDGKSISQLGQFYAQVIKDEWKDNFDIVFGPAYKGIPLCVTIIDSLYRDFKMNKKYSSNRKEMKTYADKSILLGADIQAKDKIVMVDDVLTTGQTKIDAVNLIQSIAKVDIIGLVIALDRLETDQSGQNAVEIFTKQTGIPVLSIINVLDIVAYITETENSLDPSMCEVIRKYLKQHGVK